MFLSWVSKYLKEEDVDENIKCPWDYKKCNTLVNVLEEELEKEASEVSPAEYEACTTLLNLRCEEKPLSFYILVLKIANLIASKTHILKVNDNIIPTLINQLDVTKLQVKDITEIVKQLISLHKLLESPEDAELVRTKIDELTETVKNISFSECQECYRQLVDFYKELKADQYPQLLEAIYQQDKQAISASEKYDLARYLSSQDKVKEAIKVLQEALGLEPSMLFRGLPDFLKPSEEDEIYYIELMEELRVALDDIEEDELREKAVRLFLEICSKDPEYYHIFFSTLEKLRKNNTFFSLEDTEIFSLDYDILFSLEDTEILSLAYNILSSLEKEGRYLDILEYTKGLADVLGTKDISKIVVRAAKYSFEDVAEVSGYYNVIKDGSELLLIHIIHNLKKDSLISVDMLKDAWRILASGRAKIPEEDIAYLAYPLAKIYFNVVLLISNEAKALSDRLPSLEGLGNIGKLLELFVKAINVVNDINYLNWTLATKRQTEVEEELEELKEEETAYPELLSLLKIAVGYNRYLLARMPFTEDDEDVSVDVDRLIEEYAGRLDIVLGIVKLFSKFIRDVILNVINLQQNLEKLLNDTLDFKSTFESLLEKQNDDCRTYEVYLNETYIWDINDVVNDINNKLNQLIALHDEIVNTVSSFQSQVPQLVEELISVLRQNRYYELGSLDYDCCGRDYISEFRNNLVNSFISDLREWIYNLDSFFDTLWENEACNVLIDNNFQLRDFPTIHKVVRYVCLNVGWKVGLKIFTNWGNLLAGILNDLNAMTVLIRNSNELTENYAKLNLILSSSKGYSKIKKVLNNYPIAIAYLNPTEAIKHLDSLKKPQNTLWDLRNY